MMPVLDDYGNLVVWLPRSENSEPERDMWLRTIAALA